MNKKEQSFSFTDFPEPSVLNEEKHKVVSLSPAIKLTPEVVDNSDVTTKTTQAKIEKGNPKEMVNTTPMTGKIIDSTPVKTAVKITKAEILHSQETHQMQPEQTIKITPKSHSPELSTQDKNNTTQVPNTGGGAELNTEVTQKVPIPPSKNVRIDLDTNSSKSVVHHPSSQKKKISNKPKAPPDVQKLETNFGQELKSARIAKGLTLAEIEDKTKIRKFYVEALEAEDLNALPPIIYVYAYVKTLCQIYDINKTVQENILVSLKKLLPTHLSSETVGSLNIDYEVDKNEEHKLNLIVTVSLASIVIIALVVAVSVWLMRADTPPPKPPYEPTVAFDRDKLFELTPRQSIRMTTLNPKKKVTNSK